MTSAKRAAARDDDYGSGGLTFEIDSPVNPTQLDAEIVEAMNWRVSAGLVLDGGRVDPATNIFSPVSADEDRSGVEDDESPTATVTVTHEKGDAKVIGKVIRDHEPNADYEGPTSSLDDLAQVAHERVLLPSEAVQAVTLLLRERGQG